MVVGKAEVTVIGLREKITAIESLILEIKKLVVANLLVLVAAEATDAVNGYIFCDSCNCNNNTTIELNISTVLTQIVMVHV